MKFTSKLPGVGTTIFTLMSRLAKKHGAINLSQGFPDFSSSPRLIDLVEKYMREGYNQYAPMTGVPKLRLELARKMEALYGISIDPESEITITAGATQAIFTAISAFVGEGDEVILLEPAYDSYLPSVKVAGGKPVLYELEPPHYKPDWNALSELISDKTRMIIINTPHNPTGTVWTAADMEALSGIVAGTDILVLSDEVYEHLVFDGNAHQSVCRYPGLYERSMAVYSFGKTFHNTGWKVGYCAAPSHLSAEFRKVHQFNVFSVNTPVQYALAEYLEDPDYYLELPGFFQKKRDTFLQFMEGSRLHPLKCEGTYFHLFSYRDISEEPDRDFVIRMTREYGVAAIPVSAFYESGRDERVIRLCFAKKEETLREAGKLLSRI
ncbi:MAG: methionine aminotransferase [Saprospiraceae bacterium]|nr:methionine aminotransferase [Saprospiraceae bacterium]